MTETGALERAFRDQCEGGAVLGADADALQLDLLRGADGKLPANVFQMVRQGQARRLGPGRPKGAGNRRNVKLAQLICQEHGDPVMFMASVYAMPLDQLVELLRLADDSAAMEERLYRLAEKIEADVVALVAKTSLTVKQTEQIERLVDRLADIAKVLRNKPGDLAVKALALQKQAAQAVAEYVHGKQPVSVDIRGKADLVLLVPGLNAPIMDPEKLEGEVRARGLEAVDFENMRLVPAIGDEDDDPAFAEASADARESEEGAGNG